MANTYAKIYFHIVFTVKNRQSLIHKNIQDELYKYITGIISNRGQKLMIINGYRDHVHLLLGCTTSFRLDEMVREIKEHSSKWINSRKFLRGKFNWQSGYAAFSVASWNYQDIYDYIANQEEHHRTKTFMEEYLEFLKEANIDYDPRYIFIDPNTVEE
jgi:REP element-mobilizing transposase RayT